MTRKSLRRKKQSLITLIFVSAIATAIVGDKIPFASLFSQAFPVFSNFGTVLVDEGYFAVFEEPLSITSSPTTIALPKATPTTEPAPTQTPAVANSPTPIPPPTTLPSPTALMVVNCPGAMPSRLEAGMKVILRKNLNFRSSPEVRPDNLLATNLGGTELEVVGESFCNAEAESPYRWWKLKTPEGIIGWSAEGSASGSFYFLEPVE